MSSTKTKGVELATIEPNGADTPPVQAAIQAAKADGLTVYSRGKRHVAISDGGGVFFLGGGADAPYWAEMAPETGTA